MYRQTHTQLLMQTFVEAFIKNSFGRCTKLPSTGVERRRRKRKSCSTYFTLVCERVFNFIMQVALYPEEKGSEKKRNKNVAAVPPLLISRTEQNKNVLNNNLTMFFFYNKKRKTQVLHLMYSRHCLQATTISYIGASTSSQLSLARQEVELFFQITICITKPLFAIVS